jgi:putative transposase
MQQMYRELHKHGWGRYFWAIGYGEWCTISMSEQMVEEYLENHRRALDSESDNFMLE